MNLFDFLPGLAVAIMMALIWIHQNNIAAQNWLNANLLFCMCHTADNGKKIYTNEKSIGKSYRIGNKSVYMSLPNSYKTLNWIQQWLVTNKIDKIFDTHTPPRWTTKRIVSPYTTDSARFDDLKVYCYRSLDNEVDRQIQRSYFVVESVNSSSLTNDKTITPNELHFVRIGADSMDAIDQFVAAVKKTQTIDKLLSSIASRRN